MTVRRMYDLPGYDRVYFPRKGYVNISEKYPKGIPRSMIAYEGGAAPLLARIARGQATQLSGFSDAEVAHAVRMNDPRNAPTAGSAVAAGGTALARGGPSVGVAPGAGLNLSGAGASVASAGSSTIASAGASISNMVTQYLPLAIKIGAVLIGIKLLLWLMKSRSR